MRISTAIAQVAWVGLCSAICAGIFAGCYDPTFAFPHLGVPGATPAQRTAYEQNEALRFDPYPDPTLSHVDPGERPLGYEQPREPYPLRPLPKPIVVTPMPGADAVAPAVVAPTAVAPTAVAPTAVAPMAVGPTVVPSPTVTAPYPYVGPPAAIPAPIPAGSPTPYPGAIPVR